MNSEQTSGRHCSPMASPQGRGCLPVQWRGHCGHPPGETPTGPRKSATHQSTHNKGRAVTTAPVVTGELAFQPGVQRPACRCLCSSSVMSNSVIVLVAEDRCCTHTRTPLCGGRYPAVERSVVTHVYPPSGVQKAPSKSGGVWVLSMTSQCDARPLQVMAASISRWASVH